MLRESVKSSNVGSIGYDPEARILEVSFLPNKAGIATVYQYDDVEPHEHYELVSAESIGSAMNVFKRSHAVPRKVATIDDKGVETPIESAA